MSTPAYCTEAPGSLPGRAALTLLRDAKVHIQSEDVTLQGVLCQDPPQYTLTILSPEAMCE